MAIKTTPYPEDIFAGKVLYRLRVCMGMSQDELGKKVNVTFQQIQKYEHGENQIAPRRICQFAKIFKVSPLEFFQDKDDDAPNLEDISKQGVKLIRLFQRIPGARDREIVMNLAGSLAKRENGEDA